MKGLATDRIVFQIIPNPFIRIQFRGIGGQKEEPETIFQSVDKTGNRFRLMGRMSVDNQKHLVWDSMKKPLYKINKRAGPHPSAKDHKTEFPLGTDGRDQIQSKTSSGTANHGRFPSRRPGGARMMIRTNPRLVLKKDHGSLLTGQTLNPGILLLQPFLNFLRILLVCPPDRTLRSQSQLPQQTAHRRLAQPD